MSNNTAIDPSLISLRPERKVTLRVDMKQKLDRILDEIVTKTAVLIDKRHTGMLSIELHMNEGGIGQVYFTERHLFPKK